MIWFTADTHFGHWTDANRNIIKYCNRPFIDTAEMDAKLIDNINTVVKPEDTLFHLGDFAFIKSVEELIAYRNRIACQNIEFVLGNHDKYNMIFEAYRSGYFKSVNNYYEFRYAKKARPIVLMHYPMAIWNKCHRGSIHLFGHSHGTHTKWREENMPNSLSMDVGVDCHNYRPISLDEVLAYMEPRAEIQRAAMDHHK